MSYGPDSTGRMARRQFLTALGTAAAAAATRRTGPVPVPRLPGAWPGPARRDEVDPFGLGVASGEPRPEAVVIWTRLAPA
ncbi:MAG: hypothetical protein ACRDY7_08115, partial [Acidimicrobiia bacterium]